ncbi:hypothetical protein SNOG_12808 [Parastagonospora nodorum SN15]|uniref:Uncharacterized protein n=1 Tax=Phaeosphaeria nodorum (strain SN15 / ATCC MYA-4574 / FGSC 10173) TaxID=321614 RepID=Q0U606_PHANO|nr:hypothetical protein SNOG_12808 [Parastagonospora nodorum SN15]EAT79608.1 hypothetical protein SNOG_12808 [Parastagonospora nodorum SN15]
MERVTIDIDSVDAQPVPLISPIENCLFAAPSMINPNYWKPAFHTLSMNNSLIGSPSLPKMDQRYPFRAVGTRMTRKVADGLWYDRRLHCAEFDGSHLCRVLCGPSDPPQWALAPPNCRSQYH